jgi:hypothetical protein
MQIAAIPRTEMINTTHQRNDIDEKTFVRKFMELVGTMESDAQRISSNLLAAKITKGSCHWTRF